MQRLVDTAAMLCGIPTTVKASRKFLLARAPTVLPIHHEDFEVDKVYLQPESVGTSKDYSFVRCRSQYGLPAYGMTTVRYLETGDMYVFLHQSSRVVLCVLRIVHAPIAST
jgi:hypothetical protein